MNEFLKKILFLCVLNKKKSESVCLYFHLFFKHIENLKQLIYD